MTSTTSSGLLTSILASLQAGREFESRLVKDNAGVLWNEIRFMDTDTGAFTVQHLDASGTGGSPSLPVTFVDSTATLASILAKNTEIETTANAIETSNAAILLDTAAIDTSTAGILADTAVIETNTTGILADTAVIETNTTGILADTASIDTSTAGILADTAVIETNTTGILADTAAIDTATAAINTSTSKADNVAAMVRLSGTGTTTISELVKSISIYNASDTHTGTINIGGAGAVNLLPGETVNFDAGGNANTFADDYFVISAGHASGDVLVIYTY
jgi:hypothetical protein